MHKLNFDFEIKRDSSGVFIEGYANPATQDRGNEILDARGWELENYKKNPVILFDHGLDPAFGSLPIGKAITIEARDNGLYAKAQISNSKTEKISAVRDLIDEGILKSFSVGFKPGESTKEGDVRRVKKQELLEISVVPIPMHQDSTFSLSAKTLSDGASKLAKKWLKRYQEELQKKEIEENKKRLGCDKMELIAIHVEKKGFDSLEKASRFLKKYGYAVDKFLETDNLYIFHQKNITDDIESIEVSLGEHIKARLKGKSEMAIENKTSDEKTCAKKPRNKDMPADMASMMDEFATQADSCANPDSSEKPSWISDNEAWTKAKDAADASIGRDDPESFFGLVIWLYLNKFGGKIAVPSTSEAPPVEAPPSTNETKAEDSMILQSLIFDKSKFTAKGAQKWAKDHNFSESNVDETGDSIRLRQKDPSEFDDSTFRTVPITEGITSVMGKLKPTKSITPAAVKAEVVGTPIPTGAGAMPQDSNPMIDLQKQTNILLGALISEIQKISAQIQQEAIAEPTEIPSVPPTEEPNIIDQQLQKSIDAIRKNQEDLTARLKKFN